MANRRAVRVADLIQRMVGELLLNEIKDPRLELVTITGVKVTDDLSYATIYFAAHGDEARRDEALRGFNAAAGFMRAYMRRETDLRYIPDLRFAYDVSLDEGEKIERLLREVRRSDEG